MAVTWTDWRGHDYTVGDTVLYARMSGRSCEMAEGVVEDLAVYYKDERYRWARLEEGEELPVRLVWVSVDPKNGREYVYHRRGWEQKQVERPVENEKRAKIMPTLRTSRFHSYEARQTKFVYDPEAGTGEFVDAGPRKAITLRVTESITALAL